MVDQLTIYLGLLQRGVAPCDALARVYEPDAAKQAQMLTLHQELTTVANEVGALYNALRKAGAN